MPAPGHALNEALFHYYSEFDAHGLVHQFVEPGLQPTPGVLTNFLGTQIPAKIQPDLLEPLMGGVDGPPNPGNWHADIAEWAGALRAVDLAKDTFRIVELGCGWGCWLVNTGMAARNRGLKVDLIGVEGDANHMANAAETLQMNGFGPGDYTLHHGVAGPKSGKALFPNAEAGAAGWGGEAIFYPDRAALARAESDPSVQVLDCKTLPDMAGDAMIDLLHIDIQGAEADYVEGSYNAISRQVRRMLIGTHSRAIEGQLSAFLLQQNWRLEIERPAIAPPHNGRPVTLIDGVQLWSNPSLPS